MNSQDPDYASALGVYVTSVSPDVRTNSNEITYWIDRTYQEFGDEFMVFSFYVDKQVVGFCQVVLFRQSRILFFDYLVLHKSHRSHGEYFQFARMLQEWIDNERFEFDYAVAEVSFESSQAEPTRHSVLLVTLFKQLGFGVAQCQYFQPVLGLDNPQSDMRAHLLIASRESVSSVKKETAIHIVHTIYFQHYERWYTPVIDNIEAYKLQLDKRFREFEKGLVTRDDVHVNGVDLLHPPVLPSPAPRAAKRTIIGPPLIVIVVFALFCGVFFVIQYYVQLPAQTVMLLFAASLIVFATIFAIFNEGARGILQTLLNTLKFFGQQNNVTRVSPKSRDKSHKRVEDMKNGSEVAVPREEVSK